MVVSKATGPLTLIKMLNKKSVSLQVTVSLSLKRGGGGGGYLSRVSTLLLDRCVVQHPPLAIYWWRHSDINNNVLRYEDF